VVAHARISSPGQRLPTYLALREYRLFSTVSQHIDALLLGRRQLLSQTLSDAELARVKRECVSRLVKCNVAQGLEVIVRSLEDGSVVVVNRDRAPTEMSRVGAITAYVYQVQVSHQILPI
jgi:dedicator of cytokinesis protein 3